jgi:hypothetical protein
MNLIILFFLNKMNDIFSRLDNLNLNLKTVLHEQGTNLTKIKLLEEERKKLLEQQYEIQNEINFELSITKLLENQVENFVILNDDCLGYTRKFFNSLRLITDLNKDEVDSLYIGKYLNKLRQKYTIELCITKILLNDENDENDENDDLEIVEYYYYQNDIKLNNINESLIDEDQILDYYKDKLNQMQWLDDCNQYQLILNCWVFKLKINKN